MPSRKWIAIVNITLSLLMSVFLSVLFTVGQGFHRTLAGFGYTFAFAFGTSLFVAFLIPLPRAGNWFAKRMGAEPGTGMFYILDSAVQVVFFLIMVNLVMTLALSGYGFIDGLSFFDRWWIMNINFFAIAYVTFLLVRTVAVALADRLTKSKVEKEVPA
jgi:hypothetical protein